MKVFTKAGVLRPTALLGAALVVGLSALVLASCSTAGRGSQAPVASATPVAPPTAVSDPNHSYAGTIPAPPFPTGLQWLNTSAPVTMNELRGKVVILDFWTYGCINCMHDIPWLLKIEKDFPHTLAVVGVHSAKFTAEGNARNIREIILRYGLNYPIVNDYKFQIWNDYGVNAWPTLVLIDPAGNIVGEHVGEGFYPIFKPIIASLVKQFSKEGMINRGPLPLNLVKSQTPQSVLAFPGKVLVDAARHRIFIADTDHNRIVEASLRTGRLLASIGSGTKGYKNGSFANAEFYDPQGMALSPNGKILYIADTFNNTLREANLATQTVTTLAGTGRQASQYPPAGGIAPNVSLTSPWALALRGNELYIAMAGSHQIWRMNLETKKIGPFAGNGYEGSEDGPRLEATLAQPSGLSFNSSGTRLYFANSEGSEIRYVDMKTGQVVTLAGGTANLFQFGYRNGVGTHARFQHPLGVAAYHGKVYVADTYNNMIRVINPKTRAVTTLAGGAAGFRNGKEPLFWQPGGLVASNGKLYIADTNNNSIRILDLSTGETSTLVLQGISLLKGPANVYATSRVRLSPVRVAAGSGTIELNVTFPTGFAPNALAPSDIKLSVPARSAVELTGAAHFTKPDPRFPLEFPAKFVPGQTKLTVDLSVVYCHGNTGSVCLIHQARLIVPVTVTAAAGQSGAQNLIIPYHVEQ